MIKSTSGFPEDKKNSTTPAADDFVSDLLNDYEVVDLTMVVAQIFHSQISDEFKRRLHNVYDPLFVTPAQILLDKHNNIKSVIQTLQEITYSNVQYALNAYGIPLDITTLPHALSQEEAFIFENIGSIKTVHELDNIRLINDSTPSKTLLKNFRDAYWPFLETIRSELQSHLYTKLNLSPTDYRMLYRVKSAGSLVFNRILNLSPLSENLDMIGFRLLFNSTDTQFITHVAEALKSVDSIFEMKTDLKSHVWGDNLRVTPGTRDNLNNPVSSYHSYDSFVKLKTFSNNPFAIIDLQVRSTNDQFGIDISNSHDEIYKRRQLSLFMIRYLIDTDYRAKVVSFIPRFFKSLREFSDYLSLHDKSTLTPKDMYTLRTIEKKYGLFD